MYLKLKGRWFNTDDIMDYAVLHNEFVWKEGDERRNEYYIRIRFNDGSVDIIRSYDQHEIQDIEKTLSKSFGEPQLDLSNRPLLDDLVSEIGAEAGKIIDSLKTHRESFATHVLLKYKVGEFSLNNDDGSLKVVSNSWTGKKITPDTIIELVNYFSELFGNLVDIEDSANVLVNLSKVYNKIK